MFVIKDRRENKMKNRIHWIDYVKVIACIFVVLGHFFQSIVKANLLQDNNIYEWFNRSIYCFHVPLFFICSGYLYQKLSNIDKVDKWIYNVKKKLVVLGIPYVFFSTITWFLKELFSESVNDQMKTGLIKTIVFQPTSPYWYLYCLFFMFFLTLTMKDTKTGKWMLYISLLMKIVICITKWENPYLLSAIMKNEIWFVLGMSICMFNIELSNKKKCGYVSGILFLVLSVITYIYDFSNEIILFILGILACVSIILLVIDNEKNLMRNRVMNILSNYTLPIFLMHTLVAAPTRIILLKIGITNVSVHIFIGLLMSIIMPIVIAISMKKLKYAEILLYPNKFIELKIPGALKNQSTK